MCDSSNYLLLTIPSEYDSMLSDNIKVVTIKPLSDTNINPLQMKLNGIVSHIFNLTLIHLILVITDSISLYNFLNNNETLISFWVTYAIWSIFCLVMSYIFGFRNKSVYFAKMWICTSLIPSGFFLKLFSNVVKSFIIMLNIILFLIGCYMLSFSFNRVKKCLNSIRSFVSACFALGHSLILISCLPLLIIGIVSSGCKVNCGGIYNITKWTRCYETRYFESNCSFELRQFFDFN